MTNGRMKCDSLFVTNACRTMQYNFSSNIKKIVKIIEFLPCSGFIVKREITKINRIFFCNGLLKVSPF